MLLGGSHCQWNAAQMVKTLGHGLVLVDYLANPPARALCDIHARVSTFDVDACIQAAKAHHVDGVFTVGTDQPVYTAARVADALGLPSAITPDAALKATNKRAMKQAFAQGGVPNAPYVYLSPEQGEHVLRKLGAPLVIKPLDSQGQRGVFKVDSAGEAVGKLGETLSFSREHTALVESFYPSDEVTLSCQMYQGRVYPLTLTDRQLIRERTHIGVCAAHRYPSIHAAREDELTTLAGRVALALGVTEGPLYLQFLIGARGAVVNEAACRVGGAFEDVFIPWLTGFDILRAVIDTALGLPVQADALLSPHPRTQSRQVSVQMLFCRPGKVCAMTPLTELRSMPGVLSAGYHYAVGSTVPVLANATSRFGHCVLVTEQGDMPTRVAELFRRLRVLDSLGENMVLPRTFEGEADVHG